MPNLGPMEWVLILAVLLLLFGAKRLPDTARGLGRSLRIFKAETRGLRDDEAHDPRPAASTPTALPPAPAVAPAPAGATPAPAPTAAPTATPAAAPHGDPLVPQTPAATGESSTTQTAATPTAAPQVTEPTVTGPTAATPGDLPR